MATCNGNKPNWFATGTNHSTIGLLVYTCSCHMPFTAQLKYTWCGRLWKLDSICEACQIMIQAWSIESKVSIATVPHVWGAAITVHIDIYPAVICVCHHVLHSLVLDEIYISSPLAPLDIVFDRILCISCKHAIEFVQQTWEIDIYNRSYIIDVHIIKVMHSK